LCRTQTFITTFTRTLQCSLSRNTYIHYAHLSYFSNIHFSTITHLLLGPSICLFPPGFITKIMY
jgi:hypothetical protein